MSKWTMVADAAIYDECLGLAEVVSVSGGIFYLRWITSTTCYDCMNLSDEHFKTIQAYPKEEIFEIKNIRLMDSQSVIRMRRESIKENNKTNEFRKQLRSA